MAEPKKLARTLLWLVENGHIPGLLPDDVLRAAATLLEQEAELETLRLTQAVKTHNVRVEVSEHNYRKEIRGTFIIADPRIYFGEVFFDAFLFEKADHDLIQHLSRQLAATATRDWMRDIEEKTYAAFRAVLASAGEAGAAETVKQGSVHEHAAREAGDAQ